MTDKVQKESASSTDLTRPEPGEASQGGVREASDTVDKLPPRPEAPRGFSMSQHDLIVPKPAYHGHLEELEDLPDTSATEEDEEESSQIADYNSVASRKNSARKQRIWMFIIFLMFIYAVFRTMRFMH